MQHGGLHLWSPWRDACSTWKEEVYDPGRRPVPVWNQRGRQ